VIGCVVNQYSYLAGRNNFPAMALELKQSRETEFTLKLTTRPGDSRKVDDAAFLRLPHGFGARVRAKFGEERFKMGLDGAGLDL